MKAPKISLDSAKLQQLMLQHVEKIVLAVVLLVVAYFVYSGAILPGLDPSKTPDQLQAEANNVKIEINKDDHWKKIEKTRVKTYPVQDLVKVGHLPNLSRPYDPSRPLKTPDYAKAMLRTDPRILAPKNAIAIVLHGPLAMLPAPGETDQILKTELAGGGPGEGQVPRQPVVQPPRPPGPAPGPNRQPPGEGRGPRNKQGRPGAGVLEGPGEFQPQMNFPGQPGGQAGDRSLPPEAVVGFHSAGEVIAKEAQAVVVLAAVPLEQQYEEFDKAFKDALDYDPIRDIPRYATFRVERADVTADPNQDPDAATWQPLKTANAAATETMKWGPSPSEVVDLNSIDPTVLTHRVPPFLQREIFQALVHPDIPLATAAGDPNAPAAVADPAKPQGDDEFGGQNPLAGQQGGAQAGLGEGGPRLPPGMRMPGPNGPGQRMMQGFSGEGQGPGMSGATEVATAKYRLIRFTDTTVVPKHKYRYRVKVVLEDPNNPCLTELAKNMWDPSRTAPLRKPPIQSITENVKKRRDAADAKERHPFLLVSDASEPTDVVELPEVNHYFAGQITPGKGNAVKPGTPTILTIQPTANLLTVAWDTKMAVDVPAEKEVLRGAILNFTREVEVIHPAKLLIVPIGEHTFKTNSIVVDFAGGNEMPTVDFKSPSTEKVMEPTEILIFDGEGKLQLLDEADDVEGFRRYLPPKVVVPEPSSAGTTIGPGDFPGGNLLDGPPRPIRPKGGGK